MSQTKRTDKTIKNVPVIEIKREKEFICLSQFHSLKDRRNALEIWAWYKKLDRDGTDVSLSMLLVKNRLIRLKIGNGIQCQKENGFRYVSQCPRSDRETILSKNWVMYTMDLRVPLTPPWVLLPFLFPGGQPSMRNTDFRLECVGRRSRPFETKFEQRHPKKCSVPYSQPKNLSTSRLSPAFERRTMILAGTKESKISGQQHKRARRRSAHQYDNDRPAFKGDQIS
jgi:hypothetical protein